MSAFTDKILAPFPDEVSELDPTDQVPVRIDLQRMSIALSAETISVPAGLLKEEKREFIVQHAK